MGITTTETLGSGQLKKTVRVCDLCGFAAAMLCGGSGDRMLCESCADAEDAARSARRLAGARGEAERARLRRRGTGVGISGG